MTPTQRAEALILADACMHPEAAALLRELAAAPQRQPLTKEQLAALYEACLGPTGFGGHENNTPERVFNVFDFARAVERAYDIGETK